MSSHDAWMAARNIEDATDGAPEPAPVAEDDVKCTREGTERILAFDQSHQPYCETCGSDWDSDNNDEPPAVN